MLNISHTVYPEEQLSINDWFLMLSQHKEVKKEKTKEVKVIRPLGYFKVDKYNGAKKVTK